MLALIMVGAGETTELLKPLISSPRLITEPTVMVTGALPSGHATAAMALALCAVIAAPPRARPVVAAVMGAFTIAICYSILELGWHFPSDALAGLLVATAWSLAGMAALVDGRGAPGQATLDPGHRGSADFDRGGARARRDARRWLAAGGRDDRCGAAACVHVRRRARRFHRRRSGNRRTRADDRDRRDARTQALAATRAHGRPAPAAAS